MPKGQGAREKDQTRPVNPESLSGGIQRDSATKFEAR